MKGWERQRIPNLFSNKDFFVSFRDPINFVGISGIGNYFRFEGFVESGGDRSRVLCNPHFVEFHPLSEVRDEGLNLGLKL